MKSLVLTLILSLSSIIGTNSYAQTGVIYLTNPSFEGSARLYSLPKGWKDCGEELFPKETPPDIHPMVSELFSVQQKPAHKSSYLGLLFRDNGTWESISQRLVKPIKANQCYAFRVKMCQSEKYKSGLQESRAASLKTERERAIFRILTKITERKDINFTDPVVLRIWGGDEACDRKQLLAVSPLVKNKEWADYFFKIQPEADYQSLTLEVFDGDKIVGFPNGHVLLDDVSPLIPIDCDMSEEELTKIDIGKYDLLLATIDSKEDLEWFVLRYSSRLGFNFRNQFTRSAKKNFKIILAALNKFPNQKLVFLVDGEDRWMKKQRIETVLNQIASSGFPNVQCEVRMVKVKERKEESVIRGNGIFIKIMPK
jgi:hypothetical protein